jgi:hypothetical protein
MTQEQATTSAIAYAAVNNQDEMVAILSRNGVIVPTETLTLKMLIELIVNALAESRSFQNDFLNYLSGQAEMFSNVKGYGPVMQDGSFTSGGSAVSGGDKPDIGKYIADAVKIGFGWLQGRQQVTAAEALAKAEEDKLEAERIKAEGSGNIFAQQIALGRLSTTRVVVFGLIGVALIGTAIYFFTRKKA